MGRRDTDVERKRQEAAEIGRAALQRALAPELERVEEDQARVDDVFRPMTAALLTRLLDRTLTAAGTSRMAAHGRHWLFSSSFEESSRSSNNRCRSRWRDFTR